ncbi:uncharacterized protein LOC116413961, partial [Apis florea]|uniref:uncharacterized protein LOC116413961 n=1 Tax=Apis florea TaxID=7463 RepID=UPI0012FE9AC5
MRYMDTEGSMHDGMMGNNNWVLGDLRSLHRCVPTFRRPGIEVGGMRTHFYPEGGWGWLVCAAGFLALLLTTGMQLAFGLLHVHAVRRFGEEHLMDLGMFSYTFLHALPIFSPLLYDNTFLSRERNIF